MGWAAFARLVDTHMLTGRPAIDIELDNVIDIHIDLTISTRSIVFLLLLCGFGRRREVRVVVLVELRVEGRSVLFSLEHR